MTKSTIADLANEALDAFWQVIVRHNPQAKTGDLSPWTTINLTIAAENAIEGVESRPMFRHQMRTSNHRETTMSNNEIPGTAFDKAIALYGDRDPDPATQLIDLLADIRHWCDRHGEDFARLDRLASTTTSLNSMMKGQSHEPRHPHRQSLYASRLKRVCLG